MATMNAREFGAQSFHQAASVRPAKPEKSSIIVVERFENGTWVEHKLYLQADGMYKEAE
jgi:hypothetical protein